MFDFTIPGAARLLSDQIAADCDEAGKIPAKFSWLVKPSSIGGDCLAREWFAFRWVAREVINERTAQIFAVGNQSESRMVDGYRKAGWTVLDVDPAKAGSKFPQWNVKALDGHMSAYLDAKASHPIHTHGVLVAHEYKTMKAREWATVSNKQSIRAVKQEYYAQSVIYLMLHDLPWSLMTIENKDTQEKYREVIPRNDVFATSLLAYGETIRTARQRPARVAESPAYFKCGYCTFKDVCHYQQPPMRNCRSCVNAEAVEKGKWRCVKWDAIIPGEKEILENCPQYQRIA